MQKHQSKKYFYKEFHGKKKIPIRFITLMKKCKISTIYAKDVNDYIYIHICNYTRAFNTKIKSKTPKSIQQTFLSGKIKGQTLPLHPFCIKKK